MLLAGACSQEAPPSPDIATNKQLIWDAIKAYHDAGDQGKVPLMKALLHPEVVMYKGAEDFVRGIPAVEEELERRAEQIKGEGRKTLVGGESIQVMGDVAVATYIASTSRQRGAVSVVFRKSQGKWLIAHVHDSWPAPAGPATPK